MFRFLLGVLVGSVATAACMRQTDRATMRATGRVDELSTAARNIVADPAVNAGDGTPGRTGLQSTN
jgi:hypothetical protein